MTPLFRAFQHCGVDFVGSLSCFLCDRIGPKLAFLNLCVFCFLMLSLIMIL